MAPPCGNESSQDLSSPNFHQSIKACTITSDEVARPRSRRAGRTTPVCLWWKQSFRLERGHFIHQITPRRSQEPLRHPSAPLIHRLQDRDFLKRKAKTYIRGHHMMPPASPKSRPRSGCHRLGGVMQGTCFYRHGAVSFPPLTREHLARASRIPVGMGFFSRRESAAVPAPSSEDGSARTGVGDAALEIGSWEGQFFPTKYAHGTPRPG